MRLILRPMLVAGSAALVAWSCTPERLVPAQVAMGAARLSVRNAANIVSLIEKDTVCGFSSSVVKNAPELTARVGDVGEATFRVDGCVLDLGQPHEVSVDCNRDKTLVGGRVVVSAKKVMRGHLTGNVDTPVVPDGPDAVRFEVTARGEGFQVLSSASAASMTINAGELSFIAAPRLAVSAELGVCSVATSHVTMSELRWKDGVATIRDGDRAFEVDIPQSHLSAQVGRWEGQENALSGTIQVWQALVRVPTVNDQDGLDPTYNAGKWERGFECTPDLLLPVSHECRPLTPTLAEGAARLTVQMFGAVASMVNANTSCGFSSDAVVNAATTTGELGVAGGSATFSITNPCRITVPAGTVLSTDCAGVQTVGGGTVVVTGTKTVRGVVSGELRDPIVPTGRDPAELRLNLTFEGFKVSTSDKNVALTGESGVLSGTLRPRVGKDTVTGACSIPTPVAQFEDLQWQNGTVLMDNEGLAFRLPLESSSLSAQNGTKDGVVNQLSGNVRILGESITVPLEGNALNPDYNDAAFMASFACTPNLVVPASDAECSLRPTLLDGAARLTVANFAAVLRAVDKDTSCGFSSPAVLGSFQPTGTLGERGGSVVWTISQPCTLDFPTWTTVSQDCNGVLTQVRGRVVVTGTKTVRGFLTGDRDEPAVPTSRDPAEITLRIAAEDFTSKDSNRTDALRWASGSITGTVRPRLAQDTERGACSISTPVVEFDGLKYTDARVYVQAGAKSFRMLVSDSLLAAQNGTKGNRSNYLRGTFTADGEALLVPLDQTQPVLNPTFNQAAFDASYACTPHMRIPASESECSFTRTLAEGVGRLLIQTAGTLATMVNHDGSCGFENLIVQATPDEVQGDAGEMGLIRWEIPDCDMGWSSPHAFERDCNDGTLYVDGYCTLDAGRTVRGLRESLALVLDSIVPVTRQAVELRLNDLRFEDFSAYHADKDGDVEGRLVIQGAQMSSVVKPVLGERADEAGTFDVPLPVAFGTSQVVVTLDSLTGYLESDGKRFNIRLGPTMVDGFNGTYQGRSNELLGHVTVDGERVDFAPRIALNPHFEPADFQAGYICSEDLAGPIPAQ